MNALRKLVLLSAFGAMACVPTEQVGSRQSEIFARTEPLTVYTDTAWKMARLRPAEARRLTTKDKASFVDIIAPQGTAVYAPVDGRVTFVGVDPVYGTAKGLKLSAETSTHPVYLSLWNLDDISVARGTYVKAGEQIGIVSQTNEYIYRYHSARAKNTKLKIPAALGYLRVSVRAGLYSPSTGLLNSPRNAEDYLVAKQSRKIECIDPAKAGSYPKTRFYKALTGALEGPRLLYPVACDRAPDEAEFPTWAKVWP